MKKHYKITLILLGILLVATINLGVTYALWQITEKQTDKNIVSSGCLEITFEETSNSINLTKAYPITDEEGMKLVPYKFKIKNTCTIDSKYYVTLNSFGDTATAMDDAVIKYAFNLSSKNPASFDREFLTTAPINIETASLEITDLIESYIIKEDYLRIDEEKEYSLYLWIDYNADNEVMGETFQANLSIINVATDKAPLLANLVTTTSIAATGKFLNGPIVKNTIEKLEFVSSNKVPTDAISSWDVSAQQNGGIMAWYYDVDANGKYEVYIGQEGGVIANSNSSYLFQNLTNLSSINLTNLDTSNVTDMSCMFDSTGYSSKVFTLDLGNQFNTSNVTNMSAMFYKTGYSSPIFTLDLGDNFDTSKVTKIGDIFMNGMFDHTGYNSTVFTLDLGDKFDTSNVTSMFAMFNNTGYSSKVFTLDLGDKFDTSNVTDMMAMFCQVGHDSPVFTLDLGDKFDTSNVRDMVHMFHATGYSNKVFALNFGNKFDTSKVESMEWMFSDIGYSNPNFILDLRMFNFDSVFKFDLTFSDSKTTHTAYVKNASDKAWVNSEGFAGTIIDCSLNTCP